MNATILSLVMNGAIIVLLIATIVFAVRLSNYLKAFRQGRGEMEKLIAELSQQIDKANVAISGMRVAAKDAGKSLQDRIDQAHTMSDELQLMTQSGSKLVGRMERQITERPRPVAPAAPARRAPARQVPEKPVARRADEPPAAAMASKAERELYDALQRRGRKGGDE